MPYLKEVDKKNLELKCNFTGLLDYFAGLSISELTGHLNYIVFKIVKIWVRINGKKYFIFAAIIGTMVCCILEIYRRLVAPYENIKIKENGDVE